MNTMKTYSSLFFCLSVALLVGCGGGGGGKSGGSTVSSTSSGGGKGGTLSPEGGTTTSGGGTTSEGGSSSQNGSFSSGSAEPASCINIPDDLLADFTEDSGLHQVDGREGGFYVYGDGSLKGVFDPPFDEKAGKPYPIDKDNGNTVGKDCSGPGSLHVKASGWGVWGAALGVDLKPRTDVEAKAGPDGRGWKGTYDASKYKGVSFWAKAAAPLTRVQVSFPDVWTDGYANPSAIDPSVSTCVYSTGSPQNCSPYLVKLGDSSFPKYANYQIGTEWKRFDIFFEDAKQDEYNKGFHREGENDRLDTEHLTAFVIQVNAIFTATDVTPNDFEIWVDDISFIKK